MDAWNFDIKAAPSDEWVVAWVRDADNEEGWRPAILIGDVWHYTYEVRPDPAVMIIAWMRGPQRPAPSRSDLAPIRRWRWHRIEGMVETEPDTTWDLGLYVRDSDHHRVTADLAGKLRASQKADALACESRDALAVAIETAISWYYLKPAQELAQGATEQNTGGPGNWLWLALEALKGAGRITG